MFELPPVASFAAIRSVDVPEFIVAHMLGAFAALLLPRFLLAISWATTDCDLSASHNIAEASFAYLEWPDVQARSSASLGGSISCPIGRRMIDHDRP
jgi:hypothetical protein